jgi:hypothetical protein
LGPWRKVQGSFRQRALTLPAVLPLMLQSLNVTVPLQT